jgi:hypothetical protein
LVFGVEEAESDQHEDGSKDSGSKSSEGSDWRKKVEETFFEPNGGGPNQGAWASLIVALMGTYYAVTYKKPMKEIIYMDFLNNYLTQNRVKSIRIKKVPNSEVFNHRAEIEMTDGEFFYMVLGS